MTIIVDMWWLHPLYLLYTVKFSNRRRGVFSILLVGCGFVFFVFCEARLGLPV